MQVAASEHSLQSARQAVHSDLSDESKYPSEHAEQVPSVVHAAQWVRHSLQALFLTKYPVSQAVQISTSAHSAQWLSVHEGALH